MVFLFLTLSLNARILLSLVLTLNIFHILHVVKNGEMRALYWKKRKKRKFNRFQIEVFFLPNISPRIQRKIVFRNVSLRNLGNVLQRNLRTDRVRECIFRVSGGTNFENFFPQCHFVGSMCVPLCPKKPWICHCIHIV